MSFLLLLAQAATPPPQDRSKLLVALSILMALVFVGGLGILLLRRKLYSSPGDDTPEVGFSLSDLRKMRDRGEITPEEYEITRNKVIAKVKSSMEAKPKPTGPIPPPGELEEE